MQSKAATVQAYLAALPADRRAAIGAVRDVILENLDSEIEEGMLYGMIGYYVPHRVYPPGYYTDPKQPLPFAALASQKNYMSLYFVSVYWEPDQGLAAKHAQWFRDEWAKTGKKLNMGKSCIRFRKLDDLPLSLIGKAVKRISARTYIRHYEAALAGKRKDRPPSKKS
ncbi:MAG: DUF1801 domain-containing protein [Acidobacteriia bacterium]|nr:DUF1801 domain-containing protein [Terriglobia bacterium]